MKLIIPSFNRSAKLSRTLRYYSSIRESIDCEIVVLDGSNNGHDILNSKNVKLSNNIEYIKYDSDLTFERRILCYLESCHEDELIILGNDEDVFLSSYINNAKLFMDMNQDYSSYIGRYITLCKPFLGLNRLSHFRDFINENDISMNDSYRRVSTLMTMILIGCSPVYFSIRRNNQLIDSIKMQLKMELESAAELADQTVLALSGKIKFVNEVMLLRDETNIGYKHYEYRHDEISYINKKQIDFFKDSFLELYDEEGLNFIINYIVDMWQPIDTNSKNGPGLAFTRHKNNYSSYRNLDNNDSMSMSLIRNISKFGIILSQIISWFFIKNELLKIENKKAISIFLERTKTHDKYKG